MTDSTSELEKIRFTLEIHPVSNDRPDRAPAVAAALLGFERGGLWAPLTSFGKPAGKERHRLGSLAQFLELGAWSTNVSFELRASEEQPDDYALLLHSQHGRITIIHQVTGAMLESLAPSLLASWETAARAIVSAAPPPFGVGPQISARLDDDFAYRRTRPPRFHRVFGAGGVLDMLSERFHTRTKSDTREVFELAANGPLPRGVVRERHDDLIVLRWIDSLAIASSQIAEQLAAREEWVATLPGGEPAAGWNDSGDRSVTLIGGEEKRPLSAYYEESKMGLLAVVVDESGEGADDELKQATKWLERGALPDGTPLEGLGLVTNGRAQALALRPRAALAHIESVFYADDSGELWNPFPADEER